MKVRMINADVVMMRTVHRTIRASIDNGSNPMEDLIRPATFDVGIMIEIQLRLPSCASEKYTGGMKMNPMPKRFERLLRTIMLDLNR